MRFLYYIFYFVLLSSLYGLSAWILSFVFSFFFGMWSYQLIPCIVMLAYLILIDPFVSWYLAEKIIKWTNIEDKVI